MHYCVDICRESLKKGKSFLSLLYVCLIYLAIFYHQYFWINIFRFPTNSLIYAYTDRFCAQGISSILRLMKKAFERYSETFSKYCKTYDELYLDVVIYIYL